MSNVKADAQTLINELPDDATWKDLIYRIYVRQSIDKGLEDAEAGRMLEVSEVRRRFGLEP